MTNAIKQEFQGVVSRDGNDQIIIHLSNLPADAGLIIEGLKGRSVQFREPAREQTTAPGVIQSSPTAAAFDPANAMVRAGQVQLNKVSRFLADLPYTARAELLVAPQDTAKIFNRGLGTWDVDTASIRNIGASHGIHVDGQFLTGMQIFERPDGAKDVTYEQAWAKEVRAAWEQANALRQAVTTGLAIGSKKIVHGRGIGMLDITDVTASNSLYSRVGDINAALKAQGGQEIIKSYGSGNARWQFTATEYPYDRSYVCSVRFTDGDSLLVLKGGDHLSSRPVALRVLPSNTPNL
jgi:hypothetical protein